MLSASPLFLSRKDDLYYFIPGVRVCVRWKILLHTFALYADIRYIYAHRWISDISRNKYKYKWHSEHDKLQQPNFYVKVDTHTRITSIQYEGKKRMEIYEMSVTMYICYICVLLHNPKRTWIFTNFCITKYFIKY